MKDTENRGYAFWKGWNLLCQLYGIRVQNECKKQIMQALEITNETSWRMWRRGCYSQAITLKQVTSIEKIFAKFKIKSTQVWGGNEDGNLNK